MKIKEIILENQSFRFRFLPVVINDDGSYNTEEFEEPLVSKCGGCQGTGQFVDGSDCKECNGERTVSTNVLRSPVAIVDRGTLEFTEKFFNRKWNENNLIELDPREFVKIKTKLINLDDNIIAPHERNAENKKIPGIMTRLPGESGITRIGKTNDTYVYTPAISSNEILKFKTDFLKVLDFAHNNSNKDGVKKNVGIAVEDL